MFKDLNNVKDPNLNSFALEKLLGYDKIDFFHIKIPVSLMKYFILFFKNQNLFCIQANNITLACKFNISDKGKNI